MVLHLERKFTSPTETFIVNQINALNKLEHVVFTIEYHNFLEANATVYSPKLNENFATKFLRKKHKTFFESEFKNLAPTVIHGHYITDSIFFNPLTKNSNCFKICSCYGYDVSVIPRKYGVLAKYFYKKIFKEYDLFLAMTEEMKKDLLEIGCPASKIKVHYHGINTKLFEVHRDYQLKSQTLNLLTIASLFPVKGHMSVLKALNIFVKNHPNKKISYTIIGDGFSKKEFQSYVDKNELVNNVKFIPAVKHGEKFNEYLREAHVFLHPSITTKENDKEGIPGAIVEAMASGLPVISTLHGGIPYIIEHGKTGFLVEEHDSNTIAGFIEKLYDNADLRSEIGQNAKKYAQNKLDIYEKAKDLEAIYNSKPL